MSEPIKLQQEEITKITEIRKNYFNIQNAIGQIHLTKLNLENQLDGMGKQEEQVLEEYKKTQTAEQEFVASLQKTYGLGTLDIRSGTFMPSDKQDSVDTDTPETKS